MPKFQFKKLIRDKILTIYLQEGHIVDHKKLAGVDLKQALRDKIKEEADEVPARDICDDEIIGELGDVQQALDDLKRAYGVSDKQVETAQTAKSTKKGGFSEGVFVDSIELPEDDTWVAYYRAAPEKYPEYDAVTGKLDPVLPMLEKGVYRHAKSRQLYDVLGVTFHTETLEPLVVYVPKYDSKYELFARPYDMFVELVELDGKPVPRFEKIHDE